MEGIAVTTQDIQVPLTPDSVLADLKAGNERFVSRRPLLRDWIALAEESAKAQHPKAIILGCIDSRVPVEVIFDQAIGDVFVARVAGNFVNDDILGSMEYATQIAGANLVVVLGHTSCGAIKGAIDGLEFEHVTGMLANIKPAIEAAAASGEELDSCCDAHVDRVVEENVRTAVHKISRESSVMASAIAADKLRVVGAIYELSTGRVHWLDG
ncbi:MAG: carbonic anhydrase [Phycisphaera sp.]|nr:MAG: carbonic anhydrase [Phycisphaera sp.]